MDIQELRQILVFGVGSSKSISWTSEGDTYSAQISVLQQGSSYLGGASTGAMPGYAASSSGAGITSTSGGYIIARMKIYKNTSKVVDNVGEQLKGTIAKWYYILRNVSIIMMLLVLIYLGIRILISSVSSEKAKYKSILNDWVVGFCLIFLMHYIMSFSMNLNDKFIDMAKGVTSSNKYVVVYEDEDGKIEKELKKHQDVIGKEDLDKIIDTSTTPHRIVWNTGNLMGMYRVNAALQESGTLAYVGYVLAFLVLVWYTIFFLFSYMKRIIYLAFLTMIAPLVALTYPIDKIRDGKAQAFEMWFKEYIGNLVIQPVHLILYTVLIGAAFDLASKNVLYTLVAIGFMLPAEKFVKRMFGLDRAQTPGTLGGALGAGIAMNAMNKLLHLGHHSPKPQGVGSGSKDGNDSNDDEGSKSPDTLLAGMDNASAKTAEDKQTYTDDEQKENQVDKDGWSTKLTQDQKDELKAEGIEPGDPEYKNALANYGIHEKMEKQSKEQAKEQPKMVQKPKTKIAPQQQKVNQNKIKKLWSELQKKHPKITRPIKGLAGAAQEYAGQKLKRIVNNVNSGAYLKGVTEKATGAFVGTAAGLVGASIGIASEDPQKIWQYGAGLGAAGYALGSTRKNNTYDMDSIKKAYEIAQYDNYSEYKSANLEKQAQAFVHDNKTIQAIQREFADCKDLEDAQNLAEGYKDLYSYGTKDLDEFVAAIKMSRDKGWDQQDRKKAVAKTASIAKMYRDAGKKPSNMTKKEYGEFEDRVKKIAASNKLSDDQQKKFVDAVMNNVEEFAKSKDSLKEIN